MKFSVTTITALLFAGNALAAPLQPRGNGAAAMILKIAPDSATCADPTECRTADQVADPFIDAMTKYGLNAAGQIAAVLALTAFESVNYKYKHNVSPGRPGQGTSNMQMFKYNQLYAQSIPELKDALAQIGPVAEGDNDKMNAVLHLVQDDKYNFGSGPWFLTTQCDKSVLSGLATGTDAGFAAYMACVGVTLTDDRNAYWTRAKQAFSLA